MQGSAAVLFCHFLYCLSSLFVTITRTASSSPFHLKLFSKCISFPRCLDVVSAPPWRISEAAAPLLLPCLNPCVPFSECFPCAYHHPRCTMTILLNFIGFLFFNPLFLLNFLLFWTTASSVALQLLTLLHKQTLHCLHGETSLSCCLQAMSVLQLNCCAWDIFSAASCPLKETFALLGKLFFFGFNCFSHPYFCIFH